MPWATNEDDGVTIYYEHDDGDGTDAMDDPIVFVQGLGYGRWMWRWQREGLREFDVIAPDNRGTGRSDVAIPGIVRKLPRKLRAPLIATLFAYSIDDMAADLEAVLADAGVRDAHIVGASMGGMIALRYALEYTRAKSLTLCCTTHGGADAVPIPEETRERILETPEGASERETIRHRMRPAFNDRFTNRNPHLMDRIIEWRLEQDADESARIAQATAAANFDVSDRLQYVRVPTLVLHGTNDRVVPVENARLVHEKLPESRLELLEGGSHMFVIEDANRVNDYLEEFLRERAVA